MFSVVIPTMLKSERIHQLILELHKCDSVGEIIIINNVNSPTNLDYLPKVWEYCQEENIGVNPAWNLGVKLAKFDKIALCNDDINFNSSVFDFMDNWDILPDGCFGMATENYSLKQDGIFTFKEITERPYGWGCLMMFNKSNYKVIPIEMKIACGDDYLLLKIGGYKLDGLKVETEMSSTSKDYWEQSAKDLEYFNTIK